MVWDLCIKHAVCGFLPLIAVLAVYFIILFAAKKKQTIAHIIMSFVFCFYLIGILTMTGIWWFRSFSPNFNWIPFVDMIRGPVDTVLNVVLFVPLGMFLPILYKRFDKIWKVALAGFLISLSVEIVQMFGCGSTDINDLMTNTIGTCLGYCVFLLLNKIVSKPWLKSFRVEGAQCYYELPIFWVSAVLIMTTIQLRIFHEFF